MEDSRCKVVLDETDVALKELAKPTPDPVRLLAILNDAQCKLIDIIDGGIGKDVDPADLNHLDAANAFLRRAIKYSQTNWAASHAEQFVLHAREHVLQAYSGNVVPLRRSTPDGVA